MPTRAARPCASPSSAPAVGVRQHVRVFSERLDTTVVAIVGRDDDRTRRQAAEAGTAGLHRHRRHARRRPAGPRHRRAAERAPLRPDAPADPGRRSAPRREAARVRPCRGGPAPARGGRGDLFLAINFNHRYAEPMLRARAAITAGALGDIVFTSWRFGGEANIGTHPHAQLIETQCHAFDTIEHLCGPIVSVMAQMARPRRRPVHDRRHRARARQRRRRQPRRHLRLVVRLSPDPPAGDQRARPDACWSRTRCAG